MFGIVFLKSRKEPMEKHYYSVDYRYNGLTDEQIKSYMLLKDVRQMRTKRKLLEAIGKKIKEGTENEQHEE